MITENWLAHRVQRYHSNPHLARIGQTNADHAHGVASIVAILHPEASATLLRAALWHDAGERWAGDLPQPFKVEWPDIARQHRFAEGKLALRSRPPLPALTPDEELWLKLADSLEAVLFCGLHRPQLLRRQDWDGFVLSMLGRAAELGVYDQVILAMATIEREATA